MRVIFCLDDGQHLVFEVKWLKINEPFVVRSDTGGVVNIEPRKEDPDA